MRRCIRSVVIGAHRNTSYASRTEHGFRQNSGLDPDFGQERQKKQPRFESESKRWEDRIRRLRVSGP